MEKALDSDSANRLTLESVRECLIRQEDTIIFCLIERAKHPMNSPVYDDDSALGSASLVEYIVKETEAVHAKVVVTTNQRKAVRAALVEIELAIVGERG
ncbi:chorismate mutase [Sarracenia purpurea var. burkii]